MTAPAALVAVPNTFGQVNGQRPIALVSAVRVALWAVGLDIARCASVGYLYAVIVICFHTPVGIQELVSFENTLSLSGRGGASKGTAGNVPEP